MPLTLRSFFSFAVIFGFPTFFLGPVRPDFAPLLAVAAVVFAIQVVSVISVNADSFARCFASRACSASS